MNRAKVLERIRTAGIIPVIRADSHAGISQLLHELVGGGIPIFEITMTIPAAVSLIETLVNEFGDDAVIGAGTVMTNQQANDCISAGANFIVSPVTDLKVIEASKNADVCVFPGALSPTEIEYAWSAGADAVKVFPISSVGGAAYLKYIKSPLPHIELIPSGGVSPESIGEMIGAGSLAVGIGTFSAHLPATVAGSSERIKQIVSDCTNAVKTARKLQT